MDKSNAIKILNGRKLIATIGTYELRVTSVVPHVRKDGTAVTIINLQAMTDYHAQQARTALGAGNYQEATNFALSTNVLSGAYTPAKGEFVNVRVDSYTNTEGIQALGVVAISPIVAKAAANVNFSDFEDELENESEEDLTAEEAEVEEEQEQEDPAIV